MWEAIPPQVWTYGGPCALLAMVFLMVMRGHLVPAREVDRLERERDEWKALAKELATQNRQLLGGVAHAADVLDAIPVPHETPHRGAGP